MMMMMTATMMINHVELGRIYSYSNCLIYTTLPLFNPK
jgi:hypothetical protein